MSKESFKSFARLHPELASHVLKGNHSWQQFYELYEIYGEDSSVWGKYVIDNDSSGLNNLVSAIKGIDMDSVEKGINNLKKTVGLLQEFSVKNNNTYKKFDD